MREVVQSPWTSLNHPWESLLPPIVGPMGLNQARDGESLFLFFFLSRPCWCRGLSFVGEFRRLVMEGQDSDAAAVMAVVKGGLGWMGQWMNPGTRGKRARTPPVNMCLAVGQPGLRGPENSRARVLGQQLIQKLSQGG